MIATPPPSVDTAAIPGRVRARAPGADPPRALGDPAGRSPRPGVPGLARPRAARGRGLLPGVCVAVGLRGEASLILGDVGPIPVEPD